MWSAVLMVVVLASSGVFAGGLVMVAAAVVPAFRAVPSGTYVQMHQYLDRYIERYMPYTAGLSVLTGATLFFLSAEPRTRAFMAAGVLLTATVSAISQFGNVPLNKQVKKWVPEAPPPPHEKTPLLERWRRLHLARVVAGAMALLSFIGAVVIR